MNPHVNVLALFARSGEMVKPWRSAGYSTLTMDICDPMHDGPHRKGDLRGATLPSCDVLLCFPPCTDLASSGARWWKAKGPAALTEALALVDTAKAASRKSVYWMIENPVGRLSTNWRKPDWLFDPCDYAGLADHPEEERYTKRTCIWANFDKPSAHRMSPILGSKMHLLPPSKDRAYLRSITPSGFANAVFLALSPKVRPR